VLSGAHPDVITVEDPEHKAVPVKLVRQVRDEMFIRPNEADRKIYIFPQELATEGQNALLKILEEPPGYGVFMLLTDNPERLLPTVRSRCTELSLNALPEALLRRQLKQEFPDAEEAQITGAIARSGGWLGQAKTLLRDGCAVDPRIEDFATAFANRDAMGLLQVLVPMEKWKRDQFIPMLQEFSQLLENALVSRSGMAAISPAARKISAVRSSSELMDAIRHLQKAIEYAQGNVSVAAICGHLEYVLR
jgi:DNA polymerase-3 subunit delta'